jgi:hypothetical protein
MPQRNVASSYLLSTQSGEEPCAVSSKACGAGLYYHDYQDHWSAAEYSNPFNGWKEVFYKGLSLASTYEVRDEWAKMTAVWVSRRSSCRF